MTQLKAVVVTLLCAVIGSIILYKIVDVVIGLRVFRSKPSAKVSTSPRTAKLPTTTDSQIFSLLRMLRPGLVPAFVFQHSASMPRMVNATLTVGALG